MSSWQQAMRDAQEFLRQQEPSMPDRQVFYIGKTLLRIGEQVAPWREQKMYDRDEREGREW